MRREMIICFGLAAITLAVFWPVSRHEFINFDDPEYVTENSTVPAGISWTGLRWAFGSSQASNWHPLTWMSHMLDCQLFGLKPGAHHLVNLGFHIASGVLLFLALNQMTGAVWRSALVAGLFSWHPLHVESVAWVAERKDVLSAFFFMLTLWAYGRYATGQSLASRVSSLKSTLHGPRSCFYFLSLLCFALGLMSKPMLVTLPLVLLLLDYWPLGRFQLTTQHSQLNTALRLSLEKAPFCALSLAAGLTTLWAQHAGGAVESLARWPLGERLANALVAYTTYLGKMVWPENLAVFYPRAPIQLWQVFSFALLLACVSGFCVWQARSRPHWLVGWCWFIGMLVPVIGLVQVGSQALADRYTYLPSIGLFIILAWTLGMLASRPATWQGVLAVGTALVLLGACVAGTRFQLRHWHDTLALFTRALEVAPRNSVAHHALGATLAAQGKVAAAVEHYQAALEIDSGYDAVHLNLGSILAEQGKLAEAKIHFEGVLGRHPHHARAHRGLGNVLFAQGDFDGAAAQYELAWQIQPDAAMTVESLAAISPREEISPTALLDLRRMLDLLPTADARAQLAGTWAGQRKFQYAVPAYRAALALQPASPEILNNLAWLLATCPEAKLRDGVEAVRLAERACGLTRFQRAMMVGTLAAAQAEAGRFSEAVATAQKACALATESGDQPLTRRNQELLEQYRARRPYREEANPASPVEP